MKELYIHIGQMKTGTSALQLFFAENREKLREMGISYPVLNGDYKIEDKNLFFAGNAENLRNADLPFEKLTKKQISTMKKLKAECELYDKVLISNEAFWQSRDFLWQNLKRVMGDIQIKIIVYLRRQDEFGESLWNQRVKGGTETETCQDYFAREDLNYYAHLKMISNVVGKDNMIVRIYDIERFSTETTIFADFMSIFGIVNIAGFSIPEFQVNPPLGRNFVEIKRVLNAIPLSLSVEEEMRKVIKEHTVFAKNTEKIMKVPAFLTYDERKAVLDRYAESNRRIGQEYFGGGVDESPFPKLLQQDEDCTIGEGIYEDIIYFFGKLLIDQANEIEMLRQEIETFDLPEQVKAGSRIIVYGGDKKGRRLYNCLKKKGQYEILSIVDKRWSKLRVLEETIASPMTIFEKEFDYILIGVADDKSAGAIERYLVSSGVEKGKIIRVS